MVLCLPVNVIVCVVLSIVVCPGVVLHKGARAPVVSVAGWDWAAAIFLTKTVGVSAGITAVSPGVAVSTVAVLGAGICEVPYLVAGIAACPGLKISRAIGTDVADMAAHGTEVIHVDDGRGGRTHWGVLQRGGAWGKGDSDGHGGGRVDSVRGGGVGLTLISIMVLQIGRAHV